MFLQEHFSYKNGQIYTWYTALFLLQLIAVTGLLLVILVNIHSIVFRTTASRSFASVGTPIPPEAESGPVQPETVGVLNSAEDRYISRPFLESLYFFGRKFRYRVILFVHGNSEVRGVLGKESSEVYNTMKSRIAERWRMGGIWHFYDSIDRNWPSWRIARVLKHEIYDKGNANHIVEFDRSLLPIRLDPCTFSNHRISTVNRIGIDHRLQLEVVDRSDCYPDSDSSDFKNYFPQWRAVGLALIGLLLMFSGWYQLRNERNEFLAFSVFVVGCALLIYSLNGLNEWLNWIGGR